MKKIILLVLLGCCLVSCNQIISMEYPVLDEGIVDSIDHNGQIGTYGVWITSTNKKLPQCWYKKGKQDDLSLRGISSKGKIAKGDYVYVYKKSNTIIISKVSLNEAKAVNRVMWGFYKNRIMTNWLMLALCCGAIALVFIFYQKTNRVAVLSILSISAFIFISCFIQIGDTLYLIDEGKITEIQNKRIILDKYSTYIADKTIDFVSQKPLVKGDSIYVYSPMYTEEEICFSKTEIDWTTLETDQSCPEIGLWLIALMGTATTIFIFIIKLLILCFKKTQKHFVTKTSV